MPQHHHPVFARLYPKISRASERSGAVEHRQRLLAGLEGRVIEVGAGHGVNFSHYPPTVTRVVAVEPEPYLRRLAGEATAGAPVPVEIHDATAEALPAEDGEFDAAVVSLVLCSVADQHVALSEIARVLRPAGELRFYEHVVSDRPAIARMERVFDATFYPHLTGGCHAARDTGAAIRRAGFHVQEEERVTFKQGRFEPAHILGVALRP